MAPSVKIAASAITIFCPPLTQKPAKNENASHSSFRSA